VVLLGFAGTLKLPPGHAPRVHLLVVSPIDAVIDADERRRAATIANRELTIAKRRVSLGRNMGGQFEEPSVVGLVLSLVKIAKNLVRNAPRVRKGGG
jgi:hypothetical protein